MDKDQVNAQNEEEVVVVEETVVNEEVNEEKVNNYQASHSYQNVSLPWQFSTLGMILGVILGVIPFVLSLVGNYQIKKGYDVAELKKAYNIILIITAVLIVLVIILWFTIFALSFKHSYFYY